MTYSASDARNDFRSKKLNEELQGNYQLIKQVANTNGRWVYVNFGWHGLQEMKRILEGAGYKMEITHNGNGLKACW